MSDSTSWIGHSDHRRIQGILSRSADVIAAARCDLESHRLAIEPRDPTKVDEQKLYAPARGYRDMATAERRALFRQLLRSPEVSAAQPERSARADLKDTRVEQVGDGGTGISRSTKNCDARLGEAQRRPKFRNTQKEERRRRDEQRDLTGKRWDREEIPADVRTAILTVPPRWGPRLDYLMNVAAGVLVTALIISSVISAPPGSSADPMSVLANTQINGKHQARLPEQQSSPHPPEGFNILGGNLPQPLPKTAEDVARLHVLADPQVASAPGVVVLPYPDLPKTLQAFPEDIPDLIRIATPQRRTSALEIR